MTDGEGRIRFPDEARTALDRTLNDLVDRAREVQRTQSRLRSLLRADQSVLAEPRLSATLHRIVDAGVELLGADDGALRVVSTAGGPDDFIYSVGRPSRAAAIVSLPGLRSLLDTVILDHHPVRADHVGRDPLSTGSPTRQAALYAFLGAPVPAHGETVGAVYFTRRAGDPFTEDDEELAVSFADTAARAITNAQINEQSSRRQEWIERTGRLITAVLDTNTKDPLGLIARSLGEFANAEHVYVLRPFAGDDDHGGARSIEVFSGGDDAAAVPFDTIGVSATTLDTALATHASVILAGHDATSPSGSIIAVPLWDTASVHTLILLIPSKARRFQSFDLELADILARQASLALQLAEARADQQRTQDASKPIQPGLDILDAIIDAIYAAGLELQTLMSTTTTPDAVQHLTHVTGILDHAMDQIRDIALNSPRLRSTNPT